MSAPVVPVPYLTINGQAIAPGPLGGPLAGQVALAELSLTWGREDVWSHLTPSTATVSVFDTTGTWATSQDLVGQGLGIAWSVDVAGVFTSRVMFRGRVSRPRVAPLELDGVAGVLVTLEATSLLLDWASTIAQGAYVAESYATRRGRFGGPGSKVLPGGITTPSNLDGATVTRVNADQQVNYWENVLTLFDAHGEARAAYDPDAQSLSPVPRRHYAGRHIGRLVVDGPGGARYGQGAYVRAATPTPQPGNPALPVTPLYLDAHELEYDEEDGVVRGLDSRVTRLRVDYVTDTATGARAVSERIIADEAVLGVRALDVSVPHGVPTYTLDRLEAAAAGEAAAWALDGPLVLRGGFESVEHAVQLLRGGEPSCLLFLQRSFLPRVGVHPVVGVLGGVISYRADTPGHDPEWICELTPSPVRFTTAMHPLTWEEIDDGSAGLEVQWWDDDHPHGMHSSVTFEDLEYVGMGVQPATVADVGYSPTDYGWDHLV